MSVINFNEIREASRYRNKFTYCNGTIMIKFKKRNGDQWDMKFTYCINTSIRKIIMSNKKLTDCFYELHDVFQSDAQVTMEGQIEDSPNVHIIDLDKIRELAKSNSVFVCKYGKDSNIIFCQISEENWKVVLSTYGDDLIPVTFSSCTLEESFLKIKGVFSDGYQYIGGTK